MRKITATEKAEGIDVFSVYITDEEAMTKLLKDHWSGFNSKEALRHANEALNKIGIEAVIR